MLRLLQLIACVSVFITLLMGATCGEAVIIPTAHVAGEKGDAVLYTGPWSVDETADSSALYGLDLGDFTRNLLAESSGSDAISDGDYVAWSDETSGAVVVQDLATKERKEYLGDVASASKPGYPVDINEGRLVVGYPNELGLGLSDHFKLIDLATGGERNLNVLGLSDKLYKGVLKGNYFVFWGDPLQDVTLVALELGVRLEFIDLTTDEHTVIDPAMRVGNGPFVADNLVAWADLKSGTYKSRVRSYDITKKKLSTVISQLDDENTSANVVDCDGEHLLVIRTDVVWLDEVYSVPLGGVALQLTTLDGQTQTIASVTGVRLVESEFDQARLVDHYVVWPDYDTDEMVVYDVDTKLTKRQAMFPD